MDAITYRIDETPAEQDLVKLYTSVGWGHKDYPEMLHTAYENSQMVVCAYTSGELIGAGRAISDRAFTVYYPDLLVKPLWQRRGIGFAIMSKMMERYNGFHNQVLVAEDEAVKKFYSKCGLRVEYNALSMHTVFK